MGDLRTTLLTHYPGKALWTLIALAINAVRLPFWIVWYIPSSNRPYKKWTYRQAVRVRIVSAFLWNAAVVEMKTPLSLKPKGEKGRWVVMDPPKKSYFAGVASIDPEVQPEKIGGTWYPKIPSAAEKTGFVALHFHGGAYAIGDGRQADAGFAAKTIHENAGVTHVFCPQYRLSSNMGPRNRFPAQLQDAITSYVYLIKDMGFDPSKIVMSGDSAGANLVLAMLRFILDSGKAAGLKNPACAFLWSPWVNPEVSVRLGASAIEQAPNYPTDYLNGEFGLWGAKYYAPGPKTGLTLESPYISSGKHAFKTPVPMWVQTGGCEVLLDDNIELVENHKAVGNTIEQVIVDGAVHDIILTGSIMAFEKEVTEAAKKAAVFLKANTK